MKEQLIFHKKIIGEADLDRHVYVAERTRAHMFRIFGDGFGLSEKVLDVLELKGIKYIIIRFEGREIFWTDIDTFTIKGQPYNDRGDAQIVLPLKFWLRPEDVGKEHDVQKHLNT